VNICFQKTYQRAFGTFPLQGEALGMAVEAAAETGYRAFDTAQMYGNEADTGAALADTGIAREVKPAFAICEPITSISCFCTGRPSAGISRRRCDCWNKPGTAGSPEMWAYRTTRHK
jgi:hypothetical protein